MGCTKFPGSLSFLVDFTNTVFTDYLLPDNVIPFHSTVKVLKKNDFIFTWNSLKNAIKSLVKGILSLNTGRKSVSISTY